MAGSAPLEIRKDFTGEQHYASRNSNDLRHVHERTGVNRSEVDWSVALRQGRKPRPQAKRPASAPNLAASRLRRPASAPNLRSDLAGLEEGPYHSKTATAGRYQNLGNTSHMLGGLVRVSSGSAESIDWQLNLRGGCHQKPDDKWRRHFTRSQVSFDRTRENCGRDNEDYQTSKATPQDRRPDRNSGAVLCANLRADKLSFRRWPGCEGTDVGQWRHLIEDTSRGRKPKRQLAHETTLREQPGDDDGARICDNRSSGCVVEMLGKKSWHHAKNHDEMSKRPPVGDAKLHFLCTHKITAQADEEDRARRMSKRQWPRKDAGISEERPVLRERK